MSKFLSRMNRGVVLALLLIIGLTVYFIIDTRAFEGEVYAVQETLQEFVAAVQEINQDFCPEGSQSFIARFFTEYRNPGWPPGWPSARQNAESALEALADLPPAYTADAIQFTLLEITSIQKEAANAVRVRFALRMSAAGFGERASFFNGFDRLPLNTGNEPMTVNALMLRSGGVWRFASGWVSPGVSGLRVF